MANSISAGDQKRMHKESLFLKHLDLRVSAMEKGWQIAQKLEASMEKIEKLYNPKPA